MEQDIWIYLKSAKKPIVLYGMGNGADKIIEVLKEYGITVSGVFASDGFVKRKTFQGFQLSTYDELKAKFQEMIILMAFGSSRQEVMDNVSRYSLEQEFYAPDVPVYGTGLFTNEFLKENAESFRYVYSRLADDFSRKTFEDIINFKLSGKPEYLFSCEADSDEPYNSFLNLKEGESFLDLGAYNGDTVYEFINKCPNYSHITAVEPDPKTFNKLVNNTRDYKNIDLINACISDKSGFANFASNNGRGSNKATGKITVRQINIDEIFASKPHSFIKFDIEGEELNAIKGMKNAVAEHKPKMLMACYHRTQDLISLPLAVDEIRKDYKIYLRHFKSIPAWDTNYYFI